MKVYIWNNGDPSVGIGREDAEIELFDYNFEDDEHRNWFKKKLSEIFGEMFDGPVSVMFEDEIEQQENEIAQIEAFPE